MSFDEAIRRHTRKPREDNGRSKEPPDPEVVTAQAMHSAAKSNAIRDMEIPRLRRRIEECDEEESKVLGTAQQFEWRGRRLEAKDMLQRWLKWSGQAPEAPDKEMTTNAG